jgi:hypothetical protein
MMFTGGIMLRASDLIIVFTGSDILLCSRKQHVVS